MTEKRYDTDWAKAKSRDLVKEMIERTLLTFRKPRDLRVLCFPGIDAQEIYQVYDALEIPRENIVGVEREPKIAAALEEKELGIRIYRGSIEDYVAEVKDHAFDVVSLDYIGPINIVEMNTLQKIFAKQRRHHFVLHTANLIRRDQRSNYLYFYGYTHSDEDKPIEVLSNDPLEHHNNIVNRLQKFVRKTNDDQAITTEKAESYALLIKACFTGSTAGSLNGFLKFVGGEDYQQLLRICEQGIFKVSGEQINLDPNDPLRTIRESWAFPAYQSVLESLSTAVFRGKLETYGITQPDAQLILHIAVMKAFKKNKSFRAKDSVGYSYISESGAPMIGNVFYLSHPERILAVARDLADRVGYPHELQIKKAIHHREIYSLSSKFAQEERRFMCGDEIKIEHDKERKRIFLGNSSKPVLSKRRAIEELREGKTVDEIREKYRGGDNKPLAQWKAHAAMGTYGDSRETRSTEVVDTVEDTEDESIEKIDKGTVIDLITSGIPLEEIVQAYPTSFTSGQLRAFKAHLTMGTYQK